MCQGEAVRARRGPGRRGTKPTPAPGLPRLLQAPGNDADALRRIVPISQDVPTF